MENIFYGKHKRMFMAIYFILLLLWLSFIFCNSLADSTESTAQSNKVAELIKKFIANVAPETSVKPSQVRTTAHFIEFFVLGGLYYIGTFFLRLSRTSLFFHSLSLSLFTAVIDETIQLFSLGRGSEIADVWMDCAGAFVAHILLFALYYSYKHFKST